jgi:hypothetical protein
VSANGTIELSWATGRRDTFCLAAVAALLDIEQKCGAGIFEIWRRLEAGEGRINDVIEPIRLGLVGGGMSPKDAHDVVTRHVVPPYAAHVFLAATILRAVLVGVPGDDPAGAGADDQPKKPDADRAEGGA